MQECGVAWWFLIGWVLLGCGGLTYLSNDKLGGLPFGRHAAV